MRAQEKPLVRVGDPVRLWQRSAAARVELAAVALENGALGSIIRMRLLPKGGVLVGSVREAGSVELLAPGFLDAGGGAARSSGAPARGAWR